MATTELSVAVRRHGDTAILGLAGDIDASGEAALDSAFDEATAGAREVVLDFSRTTYINSTGIALIVGVLARARARALPVTACGLSAHYREIFEITRLADFMRITDEGSSHA
jgi:anti-anti-sigma factor